MGEDGQAWMFLGASGLLIGILAGAVVMGAWKRRKGAPEHVEPPPPGGFVPHRMMMTALAVLGLSLLGLLARC